MHCLLLVAVKVSQHVNTLVEWEQLEIRLVSIYIWEWPTGLWSGFFDPASELGL